MTDGDAKVPRNTFRAHPIPLMRAQADSIRLELLLFVTIPKETTDYMMACVDGIRRVRDEYGIEVNMHGRYGFGGNHGAELDRDVLRGGRGRDGFATSRCGRRIASNVCAPC